MIDTSARKIVDTVMRTGAKVVGKRVLVGDGACVRERCVIGDDVVIGHGSLVENDTGIGARTKSRRSPT